MHTITLVASAIPKEWKVNLPCEPKQGICCISGEETATIPRKKIVTSSFGDVGRLLRPDSDRISIDAWIAFKSGYFGINDDGTLKKIRKKPESMSCWWCNGHDFQELDKCGIRQKVFHPQSGTWAAYVTTSYKKHGAMRARINMQPFGFWAFEEKHVDARDCSHVILWWRKIRAAQESGIPRKSLEGLTLSIAALRRVDSVFWQKYLSWARDKYRSPLYQFLCYLLPSHDEIKEGFCDADMLN